MNPPAILTNSPPPLPQKFRLHALCAGLALLAFFSLGFLRRWVILPTPVALLVLFLIWLVLMSFMVYYVGVYPILHVARRYRGSHQQAWLVWLALEMCGFGFGFVRLAYFFSHILPDIRQRTPYFHPTRA